MEGQLKLALATTELQSRWDLHDVVSTATPDGEGFVLNGSKSVVLHGGERGRDHRFPPNPRRPV